VNGFIDPLCTRLVRTITYSATANLHNPQSPHQTLSLLQPAVSSLVVSWERLLTVEFLQLHALTPFPAGHRLTVELTLSGSNLVPCL
jgi:hypothetical protein